MTYTQAPGWTPNLPNLPDAAMLNFEQVVTKNLHSDVGISTVKTWFGSTPGFVLRKSQISPKTRPYTPWGSLLMPDGLGCHYSGILNIPAAGTSLYIHPSMHIELSSMIERYQCVRADVTYIINAPMPLGASLLLEMMAPEIDASTQTRSVRWKPGTLPCVAATIGWDSDVPIIRKSTASRKGHPGLSLQLSCVEDNSVDTVHKPLQAQIWIYVHNVECFGRKEQGDGSGKVPEVFVFKPLTPPAPEAYLELTDEESNDEEDSIYYAQADDGGSANAAPTVGEGHAVGEPTPGVSDIPEPASTDEIKVLDDPKPADNSGKTSKPAPTKGLNQKWFRETSLVFDENTRQITFTTRPYIRPRKGEDMGVPFRKYVWCAPSRRGNVLQGIEFKLVSVRNPQIAGMIVCQTTGNQQNYNNIWHELGGTDTRFFDYPAPFATPENGVDQRACISPWRRTSGYETTVDFALTCFNYAQAQSPKVSVTLFSRPGKMRFNTPMKPRPRPKKEVILDLQGTDGEFIFAIAHSFHQHMVRNHEVFQAQADEEAAPMPSEGFEGLVHDCADTVGLDTEDIQDQDLGHFWINAGKVDLKTDGSIVGITLDLQKMLDENSLGGETQVSEFMSRFANIHPMKIGAFGPVVGTYHLKIRPPAGITFDVEHVCLPSEMNDEAALRIFGLDSILGIAGSAISSIGGSLVSGAINTIGGVLGGVLNPILGAASPNSSRAEETQAPAISGDIPFSRFLQYLKSFPGTEENELFAPTLLLKLRDLLSSDPTRAIPASFPATLYVEPQMLKGMRAVFDRSMDLPVQRSLRLTLPVGYEEFAAFMQNLGLNGSPIAVDLGNRCITVLAKSNFNNFSYDLANLMSEHPATHEEKEIVYYKIN